MDQKSLMTTGWPRVDVALSVIAKRDGVEFAALVGYVRQATMCSCDCGRFLWRGCAECGVPRVADDTLEEIDAHVDRAHDREPRHVLSVAELATLRGVSEATVRSWRRRYAQGHPNAFPEPLARPGRAVAWDARLRPALMAWKSVGRGVGGGRKAASPAAGAAPAPVAPPVERRNDLSRRFEVTGPCVEWLAGTQLWADLRAGADVVDADGRVFKRLMDAPTNKRGAVKITVESGDEAEVLARWADYHVTASRDNAGEDPGSLGEYNAARAFLRRAEALMAELEGLESDV